MARPSGHPVGGNARGVRLSTEFDSSPEAAREARQYVRDGLIDRVPAGTLADLLTVFSELVANAVDHGDAAQIALTIHWMPDEVSGEVSNRDTDPPAPDPSGWNSGLGLQIVDAIVDEWQASTETGTTIVGFHQRY